MAVIMQATTKQTHEQMIAMMPFTLCVQNLKLSGSAFASCSSSRLLSSSYKQVAKNPQSLIVKLKIVGALVILGLGELLYLLILAASIYYEDPEGQVGAFVGLILLVFSPGLGWFGWTTGGVIGWEIERHRARTKQQ